MSELSSILVIAYRDLRRFLRDPLRIISSLVFPAVFIGILGGSFQSNLARSAGYSLLTYTFTGVFALTIFQASALGLISLVEDRAHGFTQELFVSPLSRYSILLGKIIGESGVALVQGAAVIGLGLIVGVPLSLGQGVRLAAVALAVCAFGGAFGALVLSGLSSQRVATQAFAFVLLPQYFLAGVFTPIKVLPWYLDVMSHLSPLRYAVDFGRSMFYPPGPVYQRVVLAGTWVDLAVMGGMFAAFMVAGTAVFTAREQGR